MRFARNAALQEREARDVKRGVERSEGECAVGVEKVAGGSMSDGPSAFDYWLV
jgi:hypothetical protein